MERSKDSARRQQLRDDLFLAAREHSAATVMFHSALASRAGLSPTDTKTIDTLLRKGPLTAGDLAQHTGLATASVTSLIDRLERRGLVRRVRDTKDRRRVIVEPILEKVRRAQPLIARTRRAFVDLMDAYDDGQLETILDFLRRSAERMRRVTAELGNSGVPSGRAATRRLGAGAPTG